MVSSRHEFVGREAESSDACLHPGLHLESRRYCGRIVVAQVLSWMRRFRLLCEQTILCSVLRSGKDLPIAPSQPATSSSPGRPTAHQAIDPCFWGSARAPPELQVRSPTGWHIQHGEHRLCVCDGSGLDKEVQLLQLGRCVGLAALIMACKATDTCAQLKELFVERK